ncbi:MAG: SDR family oxidoreductase [Betaproteobacteria bacterium]|nr:SDR family oxidoreductase [Betaproteobacteria bacterium]
MRLLIVGSGDVAFRALPALSARYRVFALLRRAEDADQWRAAGAVPLFGDLDEPRTLRRLAGIASRVLHCAPPPAGSRDMRTRALLAALMRRGGRAPRIVYVSTTGVYGDCQGAWVTETRPLNPQTPRALRRYDAESVLRRFAKRHGSPLAILRAPGIYAAERLPLARLKRGDPVLARDQDVFTNHIHADDLARLCIAALERGRGPRAYNASDDSDMKAGDYFDYLADCFALPRPPRASQSEIATRLSEATLSFMAESRRLDNRRIKRELRVRLRYPSVAAGLAAARARHT